MPIFFAVSSNERPFLFAVSFILKFIIIFI
nr:MAG TPA: hypothetical protein [Caudoviricetes sp.]